MYDVTSVEKPDWSKVTWLKFLWFTCISIYMYDVTSVEKPDWSKVTWLRFLWFTCISTYDMWLLWRNLIGQKSHDYNNQQYIQPWADPIWHERWVIPPMKGRRENISSVSEVIMDGIRQQVIGSTGPYSWTWTQISSTFSGEWVHWGLVVGEGKWRWETVWQLVAIRLIKASLGGVR